MIWFMKILKIYLVTVSDKIRCAKNRKYDGYQRGLALMVNNFFDKKSSSLNTFGCAVTHATKFAS